MFRSARTWDEAQWLEIRNDPEVRFWSAHARSLTPGEHHAWFQRVVADRSQRLTVDVEAGQVVATGRLQRHVDAEVSIAVRASHRRVGLGRLMLNKLVLQAPELGVERLVAYIHPSNIASMRTFMRQGFVLSPIERFVRLEKVL